MSRPIRTLSCGVLLGILLMGFDVFGASGVQAADAKAKPEAAAKAKPATDAKPAPKEKVAPKKKLNEAMTALRDRVRQTVATMAQQPFNTGENTVADLIDFSLAFGCDTMIHEAGPTGEKINGITCLCWDMPCAGYLPLMVDEGHLAARVGYGHQSAPSQLAAMFALAHVPASYPARSGETVRTVADLIEHEKLSCRSGGDMSLKLIALSYYVESPTWKNSLGEEWSVRRILREELARSADTGPLRLLAVSLALQQQIKLKQPVDGEYSTGQAVAGQVAPVHDGHPRRGRKLGRRRSRCCDADLLDRSDRRMARRKPVRQAT